MLAYIAIWLVAAALVLALWHRMAGGEINATDAVTLGAKPGVFFWALLALLVALWRLPDLRQRRGRPH